MNQIKKLTALAGLLAALGGSALVAQTGSNRVIGELPDLSAGTREIGVFGNVDWSDDISYNLNLTYGWFAQDNWQVGLQTGLTGVESDLNVSLAAFTEYNWVSESKWVPFFGASLGWANLESDVFDGDSIAVGLDVGVKYFIQSNLALSFSVGADYAFDDVFPGGDDFNKRLNIGTRFYF